MAVVRAEAARGNVSPPMFDTTRDIMNEETLAEGLFLPHTDNPYVMILDRYHELIFVQSLSFN